MRNTYGAAITSRHMAISLFALSGGLCTLFFAGGMGISFMPALVFCTAALIIAWSNDKPIEVPFHTLIYFAFCGICALSIFWSNVPYASLASFLVLSIMPLTYFIGRTTTNAQKTPLGLYLLVIVGVSCGLIGGLQSYLINANRLTFIFANPNLFSAFIVVCLTISIGFAALAAPSAKVSKALWLIAALFLLIILMLTGSRSGLVAALSTTGFIWLFLGRAQKLRWGFGFVATYFILGSIFYALDTDAFMRVWQSFSSAADNITNGRIVIWQGAWTLAKDHISTGTGFGTFYLNYPPYRLPLDPSVGDWAHWDGLQILSEIGIFGALCWYLFWCVLLVSIFKARKALSPVAIVCVAVVLGLFVQGHFTYLYLAMPFLFILGLFLAYFDTCLMSQNKVTHLKIHKIAIVMFTVIICALSIQAAGSIYLTQLAKDDMMRMDANAAFDKIEQVEAWGSPYFYEHLMVSGKRGDVTALDNAQTRCDPCAMPSFIQGLMALQKGEVKQAKGKMWDAMQKDPSNQTIRAYFLNILIEQDRLNEAATIASHGLQYPAEPDTINFYKDIISKHQEMN